MAEIGIFLQGFLYERVIVEKRLRNVLKMEQCKKITKNVLALAFQSDPSYAAVLQIM